VRRLKLRDCKFRLNWLSWSRRDKNAEIHDLLWPERVHRSIPIRIARIQQTMRAFLVVISCLQRDAFLFLALSNVEKEAVDCIVGED